MHDEGHFKFLFGERYHLRNPQWQIQLTKFHLVGLLDVAAEACYLWLIQVQIDYINVDVLSESLTYNLLSVFFRLVVLMRLNDGFRDLLNLRLDEFLRFLEFVTLGKEATRLLTHLPLVHHAAESLKAALTSMILQLSEKLLQSLSIFQGGAHDEHVELRFFR